MILTLIAVEIVLLLICLEWEKYFLSFLLTVASLVALWYFVPQLLPMVAGHPYTLVLGLICYVLIGMIVGAGKLFLFSIDTLERRRERKAKFYKFDLPQVLSRLKWDLKERPDDITIQSRISEVEVNQTFPTMSGPYVLGLWKEVEDTLVYDSLGRGHSIKEPDVTLMKGKIISWIAYWPPVLVWTLLNDPLRKLGNYIYLLMKNQLINIVKWVWRNE